MVLVAVLSAAGAVPAAAQIGEGRTGRAYGRAVPERDRDRQRECESYGHEWDGRTYDRVDRRSRDRSCYDRGYGAGAGYDGRDDRRDGRLGDRIDGRYGDSRRYDDRFHRGRSFNVRAHDQQHDRLDRLHDQWHRARGWRATDARWRRDHEELHRRLERTHLDWHRHDRTGWRIR
jgi:hypothetical protein